MYSSYSSLLIQKRDVFVDIAEDLKILNKRVVLSEIPDTLFKVNIVGFNEKSYDGYLLGTKLQVNEFAVDYALGMVYFSDSLPNDTSVNCIYKGTGYIKYPASRIYYQNADGTYSDFGNIGDTVVANNKFIYKNPVVNFADIATTYPSPLLGWVVQVTSTNNWYRYDGTSWIKYQTFSSSGFAIQSDLNNTNTNVTNLTNTKFDKSSVTDNLTTVDATKALSAKQGSVLKGLVDANTTAINTKADATSTTTSLDLKAPLASPALTGTPTAPTAAANNSSTQIATTAFVVGQAATTAPKMDGTVAIGTSSTFARADHVHPTDTSRAPVASPTFTGTVTLNSLSMAGDAVINKLTGNAKIDLTSSPDVTGLRFMTSPNGTMIQSADSTFINSKDMTLSGANGNNMSNLYVEANSTRLDGELQVATNIYEGGTQLPAKYLKLDGTNTITGNVNMSSATGKIVMNGRVVADARIGDRIDNLGGFPFKMTAGQTVTCSVSIDDCPTGWLMRWNSVSDGFNQHYTPIYKSQPKASSSTYHVGHGDINVYASKKLQHTATTIVGHSDNSIGASNDRQLVAVYIF